MIVQTKSDLKICSCGYIFRGGGYKIAKSEYSVHFKNIMD